MPAINSTFRSGEPSLPDLLREIQSGDIQLPDFQRGWVWDDDHIRSLIASIFFPKVFCEKQNYRKSHWNSAVNKAPLSAKSNRIIGGKAPSSYLKSIEQNRGMASDRLGDLAECTRQKACSCGGRLHCAN